MRSDKHAPAACTALAVPQSQRCWRETRLSHCAATGIHRAEREGTARFLRRAWRWAATRTPASRSLHDALAA